MGNSSTGNGNGSKKWWLPVAATALLAIFGAIGAKLWDFESRISQNEAIKGVIVERLKTIESDVKSLLGQRSPN
jgi:H+/Cl- antiporter ClcA